MAVMTPREIPFGLRRYPLMVVVFGVLGAGFIAWSRSIERPTYVFPFGVLDPDNASLVLCAVGIASLVYLAVMTYVRFVRRPVIVLAEDAITLPQGEFGQTKVTLRAGDVVTVRQEGPRAGGWRSCYVQSRSGEVVVRSSQLPDDESYFEVCKRLEALASPSR
jgi:hypothetical protein